jgi:hypothetical protein
MFFNFYFLILRFNIVFKNSMDNELQKIILEIIKDSSGKIDSRYLIEKIEKFYFKRGCEIPGKEKIMHQVDLLIDGGAIDKTTENEVYVYYRLKLWGYKKINGGLTKLWYWLIYKNTNLIAFLALGISLITLVVFISSLLK